MKRQRLGELLVTMGVLDAQQLRSALAHQREWGTPLGRIVREKRFCSAADLLTALSLQTGLPLIDVDQENVPNEIAALLTEKVARQHRVVPLRLEGKRDEVLIVAIAAPAPLTALDAALGVSGKQRVRAYLAADDAIDRAIARLYGGYSAADLRRRTVLSLDEGRHGDAQLEVVRPPAARLGQPEVLLYGWSEKVGAALAQTLAARGISAKVVGAVEVLSATEQDVLVAPLPALETLRPVATAFRASIIVAGKQPGVDLPRAERIGARGFLAAPLDPDLLVRAVRRCQPAPRPGGARRAHAA